VVEHDDDTIRRASHIIDIGPGAGVRGGRVVAQGSARDLIDSPESVTGRYLAQPLHHPLQPRRAVDRDTPMVEVRGAHLHNLHNVRAGIPVGRLSVITGVSGSGKSTLVSQVLAEVVTARPAPDGTAEGADDGDGAEGDGADEGAGEPWEEGGAGGSAREAVRVRAVEGGDAVDRLVRVDQRPIGRTPRSNLATYTGLFDAVRRVFAATDEARARGYTPGRFSFNVAAGRCGTCQGEGFVAVELLFLPGTYAPCPTCHGARYNPQTLEVAYRGKNIAQVLDMPVDTAAGFFADVPAAERGLRTLRDVGLGYLRLGQPATELSGGEAQRIKLATELQRARRGHTLYLLDEPTTGLHPADTDLLMWQLHGLVAAGNSVVVVEHDMGVVAGADWVLDLGPGAGDDGGRVVAAGPPAQVAAAVGSRTAPYLARRLTPGG
jgi:excinuclease ABC subunit A